MKTQYLDVINTYNLPTHRTCLIISARWSQASLSLLQIAEQLTSTYADKVNFIFWDYDELGAELRQQYDIKAVPLVRFIYEDHTAYQQYGGHLSLADLKKMLQLYLHV